MNAIHLMSSRAKGIRRGVMIGFCGGALFLGTACSKPISVPLTLLDGTYHQIKGMGNVTHLAATGKFIYALSDEGMQVIDVQDFDHIVKRGKVFGAKHDLALGQGGVLYTLGASNDSGGAYLEALDIRDLNAPYRTWVSAEHFPGPYVGVATLANWVLVAGGDRLAIYDAQNPYQLEEYTAIQQSDWMGVYDVTTHGSLAFLSVVKTTGELSVEIIDLASLGSIDPMLSPLGSIRSNIASSEHPLSTPGHFVLQTHFSEGFLWTSAFNNVYGYSISNPTQPKKERRFGMTSTPVGIYEDQYITGGFNGDIDLWAHYEDWKTKIHFVLKTDGQARDGMMKSDLILVADGNQGVLVFSAKKLQDRLKELYEKYKDKIPMPEKPKKPEEGEGSGRVLD